MDLKLLFQMYSPSYRLTLPLVPGIALLTRPMHVFSFRAHKGYMKQFPFLMAEAVSVMSFGPFSAVIWFIGILSHCFTGHHLDNYADGSKLRGLEGQDVIYIRCTC